MTLHLKIVAVSAAFTTMAFCHKAAAQEDRQIDSLYIEEVQQNRQPVKVLHAEPLYIDLIRDLGARKGEREWNVGFGLTDKETYDEYTALVEYEWAPMDRLGLEVELPFSLHYPIAGNTSAPGNKLNSLKMAAQYTFLVSGEMKTSLALGYIHEFELTGFKGYENDKLFTGNIFNPFFVAAKRWGRTSIRCCIRGRSSLATSTRHQSERSGRSTAMHTI